METPPMQPAQATTTSSSERRLIAPMSRVAPSVRCVPCASVDDDDVEQAVEAEASGTRVVVIHQIRESTGITAAVPWSDLPGDLVAAVSAMVPTALDRVRLAAVCGPWRRALASRLPHPTPPALPWLLFVPRRDDRVGTERLLYSPEDGGPVMRVSLPSLARQLVGSYDGGWVASFDGERHQLAIVNLFSGVVVPLSGKQERLVVVIQGTNYWYPIHIRKLIFSTAPTSRGCVLAAITHQEHVALCRIGCGKGGWEMAPRREPERVLDIAFCDGVLYGLKDDGPHNRDTEGLIRYKISVDAEGPPVVTAARRLYCQRHDGIDSRAHDPSWVYVSYIFELHGKPAMAVRARWSPDHEPYFRVFELVGPDAHRICEWAEVMTFGDYALFVGTTAPCRMVHIPAGRRGGVEANRIYYYNHTFLFIDDEDDDPLDGNAVCMDANGGRALYSGDKSVGSERRIVSVGYYVDVPRTATWLLPPDL